jgi:hypothetical protein
MGCDSNRCAYFCVSLDLRAITVFAEKVPKYLSALLVEIFACRSTICKRGALLVNGFHPVEPLPSASALMAAKNEAQSQKRGRMTFGAAVF